MNKLSIYRDQTDFIFLRERGKSRKCFDEILSNTLFKRRNELCKVLNEHAPGWSRYVFKDNLYIDVKLHKTDYSAIIVAMCIKDDVFKVINTDVARNAIVESINTAFKYVIHLLDLDKYMRGVYDRFITDALLAQIEREINDISRSLEIGLGYNLIDLVLSFANLHYAKPDLFYPDELKLLDEKVHSETRN